MGRVFPLIRLSRFGVQHSICPSPLGPVAVFSLGASGLSYWRLILSSDVLIREITFM